MIIISGIFGTSQQDYLQEQLLDNIQPKVKKNLTIYKSSLTYIVMGDTSSNPNNLTILQTAEGILIGNAYHKSNNTLINENELKIILKNFQDAEKVFVKKFWGSYILFQFGNDRIKILRDPIGRFPIFYISLSEKSVFFSTEINTLYDIIKTKLEFNYSYFAAYLMDTFITTHETPFKGVYELPQGCQLTLAHNEIICSKIWDPITYTTKFEDSTELKILETLEAVLKTELSFHRSIFLDFSGGLDSSAILFFVKNMSRESQKIYPINFFHPNVQSSDERSFAVSIAKELGVDYIEHDVSKTLPFSPSEKLNKKPNWPTPHLVYQKMEQTLLDFANEHSNPLFISGHGGDHIFLSHPPFESLSDYLLENGTNNFFNYVKDLGTIYRKPLIKLLQGTFNGIGIFLLPFYKDKENVSNKKNLPEWFKPKILELEKNIQYHKFTSSWKDRILPGKIKHINSIYNGLASLKGEIRGYENSFIYPLISQPLLELSLSIPTYKTFNKGYTRYLFRKAISEKFKTNSVWRKDKGETTGIVQRGLKENIDFVMNLCLEGRLVQERLVDKTLIYKNLKRLISGQKDYQWNIISLFSVELFMNNWKPG